jgi:hypothetical protein
LEVHGEKLLRKLFGPKNEGEENYVIKSFVIYNIHPILLG